MYAVDLGHAAKELELEWRLRNIPPSAKMRGIFFNGLRDQILKRQLGNVPDMTRLLGASRRSYALYPVAELVEACVVAGALVHRDAREGMRQLFTSITNYATDTWYGRVYQKYVGPYERLRWLERSREYIANYGRWRLESRGEGYAIMHKYDEYFWFDALRGSAEGMLTSCGVHGHVDAEQDGPFNGRLIIRWSR